MKRTSILIIVLMCVLGNTLYGQKYTGNTAHKSLPIKVDVIDYPLTPLGEEYKTYASEININNNDPYFSDFIKLSYKLVEDENNADLLLKVAISDLKIIGVRFDTIVTTKFGKTETDYRTIANIECRIKALLFDNKKKTALEEQDKVVATEWKDFGMSKDAAIKIFQDPEKIISRAKEDVCRSASESFRHAVVSKYTERESEREINFYYLSPDKFYQSHFDYYHFINLKRGINGTELNKPLAERTPIIEEYIEQQLSLVAKYSETNYNESRIRTTAYHNAAAAAFLIDRFDEAKKYLELGQVVNYERHTSYEVMQDMGKLKKECDIAKERLKANNKANSFNQ